MLLRFQAGRRALRRLLLPSAAAALGRTAGGEAAPGRPASQPAALGAAAPGLAAGAAPLGLRWPAWAPTAGAGGAACFGGSAAAWRASAPEEQPAELPASDTSGAVVSFPLAQTGEGISECELMQWFVKEGDVVEEFQPLCEVQSDKAAIEITSRYAGTVLRVHHAQGDLVKVGAPLVDIQTAGAVDAAAAPAPVPAAAGPSTAAAEAAEAAEAAHGGARALASPAVRHHARGLGVDIGRVRGTGPGGRVTKEDVEAAKAALNSSIADRLVERMEEKTGPGSTGGLYAAAADAAAAEEAAAAAAGAGGRAHGGGAGAEAWRRQQGEEREQEQHRAERIPLRGYRRAMVRSAAEAAAVPTFHYMDELCVDGLLSLRARLRDHPSLGGAKLTYLPFIVKAVSVALARHPGLNVSLEPGGAALLQRRQHNVGVAMATSNGLVVPNVKGVESLSVPEVAQQLAHLQQLAAAGRLSADDVTGGSLTISNIGAVGGTLATPMLNPPEAAIVALGRVQALPRYDEHGQLARRHVMAVSWGGDHRVVDGAAVAEFSNTWKALLEDPAQLLMHLR